MRVRDDLTVVMVAPKSPGSEVREEYKRGFGVPTLIAVHAENDPNGDGLEIAKAMPPPREDIEPAYWNLPSSRK